MDWATLRSDALGLTFEYPRSASRLGPLPSCLPQESSEGIRLDNLEISYSTTAMTADAAADLLVARQASDPTFRADRRATTVAGRPAVALDIRAGGLGRLSSVTFVANGDRLYTFAWSTGGTRCELGGPQVYAHVISSVRFLDR